MMKLDRKFSKELAPDLRQETARRLKDARSKPETYEELKKKKTEESRPELEMIKKDIWGRIFKTEKYKKMVKNLNYKLEWEKEFSIEEVQKYYRKEFDRIMSECPLSLEERDEYLNTETLSQMTLDNYLVLLKRLSGEAFYHATRYGVRENTFMSTGGGHDINKGEFVNNLVPLLKDKKINSMTSTVIKEQKINLNDKSIIELAEEGNSVDNIVEKVMNQYASMYNLDRESAHFSYAKDLHSMYGAEKDYKFYFYYPIEYILHNDFYQKTRESQITLGMSNYRNKAGIQQQYNDFEIFNFGQGVPIDAGILCISSDVEVDSETGSQYVIKNGKPELDEDGNFKKPSKTISSQEYWENFFTNNPEIKPSKIIYNDFGTYSTEDNEDLEKWADSKNIHYQSEDKKNEFSNYVKETRDQIREIVSRQIKDILKKLDNK